MLFNTHLGCVLNAAAMLPYEHHLGMQGLDKVRLVMSKMREIDWYQVFLNYAHCAQSPLGHSAVPARLHLLANSMSQ